MLFSEQILLLLFFVVDELLSQELISRLLNINSSSEEKNGSDLPTLKMSCRGRRVFLSLFPRGRSQLCANVKANVKAIQNHASEG